jgi:hypothetical protein
MNAKATDEALFGRAEPRNSRLGRHPFVRHGERRVEW